MKIAIIGHGHVGGALARNWAAKGHQIVIGARHTNDAKVQDLCALPNITAADIPTAAGACEVILVATPPQIAVDLARQMGDLSGKVLIDATNAVRSKPEPYPTAYHAFRALTGAEVVKAFNGTGFENMANPQYGEQAADMFMAGHSHKGKEVAAQLARDAGFAECYDFGGDDQVLLLEQFALAWINLAIFQGHGRGMAFKVLKR